MPKTDQPTVDDDVVVAVEQGRGSRAGLAVAVALVALLAAAAGLGAAALESSRPAKYTARAVLLIDQEPQLSVARDEGIFNKLTRLRVKYVDTVQTTAFSDLVAGRVGLDRGRVHASLSAAAPPTSLLLIVRATDRDRQSAQHLAQSAAETLQDSLTQEQARLGIARADRVTLTVVSPAATATKTSPSSSRAASLGGVVALAVLGGGLVVVAAVRRRTV